MCNMIKYRRLRVILILLGVVLSGIFASAPSAHCQAANLDARVAELEVRLHLDDKQIAELKSQVALLQDRNNTLKAGSVVTAPFEVVSASGQKLLRVVERGGGELLLMNHGVPMVEIGLGSQENPGLRVAGPSGVDENVAFIGDWEAEGLSMFTAKRTIFLPSTQHIV
jgi:hypothetical protein